MVDVRFKRHAEERSDVKIGYNDHIWDMSNFPLLIIRGHKFLTERICMINPFLHYVHEPKKIKCIQIAVLMNQIKKQGKNEVFYTLARLKTVGCAADVNDSSSVQQIECLSFSCPLDYCNLIQTKTLSSCSPATSMSYLY
jgi:hypothetical protein